MTPPADVSTLTMVGAVLAWLIVGFAPGFALSCGLRPGAGLVRNALVAPPASLGVLMVVAEPLSVLGVPVTAWTVLPVAAALVALVVFLARRKAAPPGRPTAVSLDRRDVVVLAGLAAAVAVTWLSASHLLGDVPPNDDGSNHGLFVAQILRLHTVDPTQIVVQDVVSGSPHAQFYPLAMHLVAALTSGITGAEVGVSLLLEVLMALVFLPVAMLVLARRIYPRRPGGALVAAAIAVMLPAMPWYVSYWGGLPFIMGVAFVPAVVDALAGAAQDSRPLPSGILIGACLIGMFALHTSEFVTAVLLGGVLLVGTLVRRSVGLGPVAGAAAVAGGMLVLYVLPQLRALVSASGVVGSAALLPPLGLTEAVRRTLMAPADVPAVRFFDEWPGALPTGLVLAATLLWLLVILGAVTSLARSWSPEWVVALVGVLVLTALSAMRLHVIDVVAFPWYSRWDRLVTLEVTVLPPLAGLGAATVVAGLRRAVGRGTGGSWVFAGLAAGLLAMAIGVPLATTSWLVVHTGFRTASLAGAGPRAAFAWLAQQDPAGARVLNDPTDGSAWMWALASVPPVFASPPGQAGTADARTYLQSHAARVGSDPKARAAADALGVRYAYVGGAVFPFRKPALSVDELVSSGQWSVVYESGGATVLERRRQS